MRSTAEMGRIARAAGDGYIREKPPVVVLGHDERAAEGSEEVTGWCPVCEERAVPMRNGTCGFCDTPLEDVKSQETSDLGQESEPRASDLAQLGDTEERWPHTEATARRQVVRDEPDQRIVARVKRARSGDKPFEPILARPLPTAEEADVAARMSNGNGTSHSPSRSPILDFLKQHGPTTATKVGEALERSTGNISTRLRQLERAGYVRRTGRSVNEPGGRGGPRIEWEICDPDKPPTDETTELDTPATVPPERQEMRRAYFDKLLALLSADAPEHIFDRVERLVEL